MPLNQNNQSDQYTFDVDEKASQPNPAEQYAQQAANQRAEAQYGRSFKADQQTAGPKKPLNFKIFSVTSQDHEYPALDLVEQLSEARNSEDDMPVEGDDENQVPGAGDGAAHSGWQSQRFCVYPQDLIIQFPTLVKLTNLTFLLHQYKIPRQIELYYFA